MLRICALLAAVLAGVFPLAAATLDQHQQMVDLELGPLVIGGESDQKLAQGVRAGSDCPLVEVRLPVACSDGELILQIVEFAPDATPTGRVLATATVPAALFPPPSSATFRRIVLPRPLAMRAGTQFAIVLDNPTGTCTIASAPVGSTYGSGQGWFNDAENGHVWIDMKTFLDQPQDLPFETWVGCGGGGGGSSGFCQVGGFGPVPIPSWVPLCRCLEDDFSREQRCVFLHPSFMAMRRIPLPFTPQQPFVVHWTLVPHEPLLGAVEITDFLPGGLLPAAPTLLFDATNLAAGESITLEYEALAADPLKKPVKFDTLIRIGADEGRMTTKLGPDK